MKPTAHFALKVEFSRGFVASSYRSWIWHEICLANSPDGGGSVLIPKRVLIVPERRANTTSNEQFTSGNCLRSSEVSLRASKPPTGFDGESSRTRSSLPLAFFWGADFRLQTKG